MLSDIVIITKCSRRKSCESCNTWSYYKRSKTRENWFIKCYVYCKSKSLELILYLTSHTCFEHYIETIITSGNLKRPVVQPPDLLTNNSHHTPPRNSPCHTIHNTPNKKLNKPLTPTLSTRNPALLQPNHSLLHNILGHLSFTANLHPPPKTLSHTQNTINSPAPPLTQSKQLVAVYNGLPPVIGHV